MPTTVAKPDWVSSDEPWLLEALGHVNQSRRRVEPVDRCEDLCKALNKTWNGFHAHRRKHGDLTQAEQKTGRSDFQAISQLMLRGLPEAQAREFCVSAPVRALVELRPQVMNHETLLRRDYDPAHISESIQTEARKEHRQLVRAMEKYLAGPEPAVRDALLKKLAQIVYIVRCNIAHSEKTVRGPDPAKAARDRSVSTIVSEVLVCFFDLLFDRPSRRLAVYGTLAPGEPNASVLSGVNGIWCKGRVSGAVEYRARFPYFTWEPSGSDVEVHVLTSPELPHHLARIDAFEGRRYVRALVPVRAASAVYIANIYEAAQVG
ncbi:MAG: gamma-glutamylcyclotransferase [Polyangiaceae bacterium]|nr:gamma-glutamylcyclotransferase [Polyangiaceae bacterium]